MIDGNNDGVAECYYFDNIGYMLANTTTPDGYTVNADGAWTVNGIVQTKVVTIQSNSGNNGGSSNNGGGTDQQTQDVFNSANGGQDGSSIDVDDTKDDWGAGIGDGSIGD